MHSPMPRDVPCLSRHSVLALLALAVSLPLFEAPKNLAWLWFVVSAGLDIHRQRAHIRPWQALDTASVALVLAALVAATGGVFAGHDAMLAALDVARYVSVLWLLSRLACPATGRVLAALVLATALGSVAGIVQLQQGARRFIELHSVGHVNHSAVYLGMIVLLVIHATGVLRGSWGQRLGIGILAAGLSAVLVMMNARGVLLPLMVWLAGLVVYQVWQRRSRASLLAVLVLALALIPVGQVFKAKYDAHTANASLAPGQMSSYRFQLWQSALTATRHAPWFGLGPGQYHHITPALLADWEQRPEHEFRDDWHYYYANHAHSLYMTWLAEQGVIGLAALLVFLIALVRALWQAWSQRSAATANRRLLFLTAAGSSWLIIAGGVFNTTLHHEIALLLAILCGLALTPEENAP